MNSKLKIFGALGFIILGIFIVGVIKQDENIETERLNQTIITLDITAEQLLNTTARKVADSHEYKLHKFDCTDFSEELVGRLNHLGFDAYCVFGRAKHLNYPFHTWTEVNINGTLIQIESTTGEIVNQQIYEENYRIIKRGGKCL